MDYGDASDEIIFVISGLIRIETKSGSRNVIAGYVCEGGYFGDFEYLSK
jgi:CRP-like cAMP-binding protein